MPRCPWCSMAKATWEDALVISSYQQRDFFFLPDLNSQLSGPPHLLGCHRKTVPPLSSPTGGTEGWRGGVRTDTLKPNVSRIKHKDSTGDVAAKTAKI